MTSRKERGVGKRVNNLDRKINHLVKDGATFSGMWMQTWIKMAHIKCHVGEKLFQEN